MNIIPYWSFLRSNYESHVHRVVYAIQIFNCFKFIFLGFWKRDLQGVRGLAIKYSKWENFVFIFTNSKLWWLSKYSSEAAIHLVSYCCKSYLLYSNSSSGVLSRILVTCFWIYCTTSFLGKFKIHKMSNLANKLDG